MVAVPCLWATQQGKTSQNFGQIWDESSVKSRQKNDVTVDQSLQWYHQKDQHLRHRLARYRKISGLPWLSQTHKFRSIFSCCECLVNFQGMIFGFGVSLTIVESNHVLFVPEAVSCCPKTWSKHRYPCVYGTFNQFPASRKMKNKKAGKADWGVSPPTDINDIQDMHWRQSSKWRHVCLAKLQPLHVQIGAKGEGHLSWSRKKSWKRCRLRIL